MPKRHAVVAAIILALAGFTSCGSDGADSADSTDAPGDGVSQVLTPEPQPTAATGAIDDLGAKPPVDDEYLGDVEELTVIDIIVGEGEAAAQGRNVSVQYVGVLAADGTPFDSSWDRAATPIDFTVGGGQVIPGWDQGLQGMQVGGRRVLQIPAELAYDDFSPNAIIPANADLVFIVDLVSMSPAPPDIPEDALGTFDELGVIDLLEGEGDPVARGDILSVQYVGVNGADGIEFDSTWSRDNEPFLFIAGVSGVIEGWQQGVLGMKVGGERILQIPADQAYGQADLVFRVHLEERTPAPMAHTITFEGPAPSAVETTTLVEGTGEVAEPGAVLSANVVVMRHSDSDIMQSTYRTGETAVLLMDEQGLLPGLSDALSGISIGETRQVVLPAAIAFPEGAPEDSGIAEDDALVFIVEATGFSPTDE